MEELPEVTSSTARHKRNKTVIAEIDTSTKALLKQFSSSFLSRATNSTITPFKKSQVQIENQRFQPKFLKNPQLTPSFHDFIYNYELTPPIKLPGNYITLP